MGEKKYDQKYGENSSSREVKLFHASRQMFAIKEGIIFLAPEKATYSHARWFEIKGWMTFENDSLMTAITRGYFNSTGLYFYKGYDFIIDGESEREMLSNLDALVNKAHIDKNLHLFGGQIKQEEGRWSPRKDYGLIRELL